MTEQSQGRLDKNEGSFYTPASIVEHILDIAGYRTSSSDILNSHIIDPAAGDGAILLGVVGRYIHAARNSNQTDDEVKRGLIEHVFAYEIDEGELCKCRENVSSLCGECGIEISPDELINFRQGDAFNLYKNHIGSFDFVVGNPPYVRIHNLEEKPDSRYINGMCDLFYPFFDIGQALLKDGSGILTYIAPSSWFTSASGKLMRDDLHERNVILGICDFGHYQVFAPYATAYTAIVKIGTVQSDRINLYDVDSETGEVSAARRVRSSSCWTNGCFLPGSPEWLGDVLDQKDGEVAVRNGYATNLDKLFISRSRRFKGSSIEHPVVKASKCETHYMLYPYDKTGKLVSFDEIEKDSADIARLFNDNKEALLNRTQIKSGSWWAFGRSQGLADTFKDKVAVQSLVKPGEKVRCMNAPSGTGVYGGVYILGLELDEVEKAVNSSEFFEYAKALRKYKSGGYYALGGKDIERFLNWYHENN